MKVVYKVDMIDCARNPLDKLELYLTYLYDNHNVGRVTIPKQVFDKLRRHPLVRDRFDYSLPEQTFKFIGVTVHIVDQEEDNCTVAFDEKGKVLSDALLWEL